MNDVSSFDWTYLRDSDPVFVSPRWQPVALEPCDPGSMLGFFQLLPGRFNGKRRSYMNQTTQNLENQWLDSFLYKCLFTFFCFLLLQTNVNRTYLQSWIGIWWRSHFWMSLMFLLMDGWGRGHWCGTFIKSWSRNQINPYKPKKELGSKGILQDFSCRKHPQPNAPCGLHQRHHGICTCCSRTMRPWKAAWILSAAACASGWTFWRPKILVWGINISKNWQPLPNMYPPCWNQTFFFGPPQKNKTGWSVFPKFRRFSKLPGIFPPSFRRRLAVSFKGGLLSLIHDLLCWRWAFHLGRIVGKLRNFLWPKDPIWSWDFLPLILLMDKILHHQGWWLSHYS